MNPAVYKLSGVGQVPALDLSSFIVKEEIRKQACKEVKHDDAQEVLSTVCHPGSS